MEPIAIVGMACRVPGAASLEEFWKLLCEGHHSIALVPRSRWDSEHMFDPDPQKPGKINTRHGGFLEGIDLFDNEFFHIPPEEAQQMDPQQRIMLELACEAFDDAGCSPAELEETNTGVFIGVMSNDYLQNQTADECRHIDRHTGCGSGYCMIANRISYQFNLQGPSLAIDSACSSSLVSTFMACESLWAHHCSLAIAGGVNLILSPTLSMFYTRSGLSAPDGKCKTLSSDASGMGRGEGAAIVVLKRLSDALKDRDNIYALIRGGAVNHNGRSNGMSSPSRRAQQSLLFKAHQHAGIKARDLQYVELHGTGTLIGDAIEATALGSVLSEDRAPDHPCRVGSVKSNLGHLEGAAGVTGLIKVALCLSRGQLVPSLWYKEPNPHVPFDTLHLRIQERLQPWPDDGQPRLAGVSSLGLGGANAHLVLQSAPVLDSASRPSSHPQSLVLQLSARSETALMQMANRYLRFAQNLNEEEMTALCLTSLVRPRGHEHRATLVAENRSEMINQLSALPSAIPSNAVFLGRHRQYPKRTRVFVFPEFTSVDIDAVTNLSLIHPCFQEALAECDEAIQEILLCPVEPSMKELLQYPKDFDIRSLRLLQFGIQVAIASLWRTAGLEPDAVAGEGMGRITSWLFAGAIDLKSAVARIAAANYLSLTQTGLACLRQNSAFQIDCYAPCGKNVIQEHSLLLEPDQFHSGPLAEWPDIATGNNVDYFLNSTDASPARLVGADHSVATALCSHSFWHTLARLSIRHDIQWKNFVSRSMLMRPLPYPWQHSRFWLEKDEVPKNVAETQGSNNGVGGVLDEVQENANLDDSSVSVRCPVECKQPVADGQIDVPGLDREQLLSLPEAERKSVLATFLKQHLAEALHVPADQMEEPHTLVGLGLDSLTALQLKNRVEAGLKIPVSIVKLLDGHSVGDIAEDLLADGLPNTIPDEKDNPSSLANDGSDYRPSSDCNIPSDITELPPEDVDQMLRQLLAR